jgi:hypothetical protein
MLKLKKLWHWLLLKNPGGLACLLTLWILGIIYSTLVFMGLLAGDVAFAIRFCLIGGVLLFILVPIVTKLDKK